MVYLNLLLILLLTSCTKLPSPDDPENNNSQPSTLYKDITYTKHIKPLILKNCLPCHGENTALTDFTKYINVKNDSRQIYLQVYYAQRMPLGKPMLYSDRLYFKYWYEQGSRE